MPTGLGDDASSHVDNSAEENNGGCWKGAPDSRFQLAVEAKGDMPFKSGLTDQDSMGRPEAIQQGLTLASLQLPRRGSLRRGRTVLAQRRAARSKYGAE